MPTIIEVNVQTGEQTERNMTAQEIAALPTQPPEEPTPQMDPVAKLKKFLDDNPDVSALLSE
jgi:hypothetical protein